ncbi:MAG: ABC transporter ATP-binding protein [Terriglobales bacterium]
MSCPELAAIANPQNEVAPVVLKDVSKHFGRFAALRSITAHFEAARLYVILGENGAGKSTLLRLIAGLAPPTRGTVALLGATDPHRVCHRIGLMEHAPLLYDELDAMENLRYFAGLYGIHDGSVCAQAIRLVGLDPELKRRVGQYSQGMRQRLSLARAVLHDPELLLLDEPFSNVDVQSTREMVRLLGHMRDEGRTVFVVTHQPALLEGTADEFVWMERGRIVDRTSTLASESALPPLFSK